MPNGQTSFNGGFVLRVVIKDCSGHHHDIGMMGHIRRIMSDMNRDTCLHQLIGIFALAQIGAAYLQTLIESDAGNAAHSNAANANKVYRSDGLTIDHQRGIV